MSTQRRKGTDEPTFYERITGTKDGELTDGGVVDGRPLPQADAEEGAPKGRPKSKRSPLADEPKARKSGQQRR